MEGIEKSIYEAVGKQLKAARKKKGYSLVEVAKMVGKSKASIKRYEDADVRIDIDTLEAIGRVLDFDAKKLFVSTGMEVMDGFLSDSEYDARLGFKPEMDISEKKEFTSFLISLADKLLENFMRLDIDQQRIVLMMLKFDNVEEILDRIH